MVLKVFRVRGVNGMLRAVLMLFVSTLVVMAVMVVPIVAVLVLVAVMPPAVMNIGRVGRGGGRGRSLGRSRLGFSCRHNSTSLAAEAERGDYTLWRE